MAFKMLSDQFGYPIYSQNTPKINMYAVRLTEMDGLTPRTCEQVLHNFHKDGHQCLGLRSLCSGPKWWRIPENVGLTKPRLKPIGLEG
jgi:hypothetical protein